MASLSQGLTGKKLPASPDEPLTGEALLKAVEQGTLQGLSKRNLILACGYVRKGADGRRYAQAKEFYEAVLQARGLQIGSSRPTGRRLSFQTRVQVNGNVMLPRSYTAKLGLVPGTVLAIELDPGQCSLHLHPLVAAAEGEG